MDAVAIPSAGYLEIIIGPMWSGKTSRLLDLHKQYAVCGVDVVLINYLGDAKRGVREGELKTHDGRCARCFSVERIKDVPGSVLSSALSLIHISEPTRP